MRAHHIRFLAAGVLLAACGGDDDGGDLTTDPPQETEMVAQGGFDSPLDAVASLDGETFFFTAFTTGDPAEAALFSVPASGGDAAVLHAGFPLEDPTGLVLSCDGDTLYLADLGPDASELADGQSLVYAWDVAGGTLSSITLTGMSEAASLALGPTARRSTPPATPTTGRRACSASAWRGAPPSRSAQRSAAIWRR